MVRNASHGNDFRRLVPKQKQLSTMSSMAKLKDSRSCFITRCCARWNYANFCFFETSKLVSPQFLLLTLFCFREKNGEKNLTTNLNKFCLHAVARFATHCANRHGALHPRSKVWRRTTPLYQYLSWMISRVKFLVKIKVQVAFKKLVVVTDVQVES